MKFIPKVLQTVYQIDIDLKSFNIIAAWETECPAEVDALSEVLEAKSNAVLVDYNGHFGIAIFLTLLTEDDCEKEWDNIEYIIAEWVENAEKLCIQNDIVID